VAQEQIRGLGLHHPLRERGSHNTAPLVSIASERPVVLATQLLRLVLVVDRADELRWSLERRVVDVDHRLSHQGHHRSGGESPKRLLQPVADEALGLGYQVTQRVGATQRSVGGALQSQEPHLGAVAVHHDQLMVARELRQWPRNVPDLVHLRGRVGTLAATQQRIATKGYDDTHFNLPGWRP
jgi:hypothetical protein